MGLRLQVQSNVQFVTAHQTAGRMDQDVVTNLIALGIEALQDAQRPIVQVACHTMTIFKAVIDAEFGFPAHGFIQKA